MLFRTDSLTLHFFFGLLPDLTLLTLRSVYLINLTRNFSRVPFGRYSWHCSIFKISVRFPLFFEFFRLSCGQLIHYITEVLACQVVYLLILCELTVNSLDVFILSSVIFPLDPSTSFPLLLPLRLLSNFGVFCKFLPFSLAATY